MSERKGPGELSNIHTPTVPGHGIRPTHHRTVEPPNPVLLLIGPRFEDEPALLLPHDRCAPLAPRSAWWSGSRREKERASSQSYRLTCGCGSGLRWPPGRVKR